VRCMADGRCRARDERGDPALTDGFLCFYCLESAERDVRALVLDYRDLEQHLAPSLGVWGSGMPSGKGAPAQAPLNLGALSLQQDIWWMCDAWDAVVRDVCRLSDKPPRVRAGWAVQQSVSILSPRLDVLACTSGVMWDYPGWESRSGERTEEIPGWQGVLDLAHLHARARAALGLTQERPELCLGVPCRNPDCDLKTLYRLPGSGAVKCHSCGLHYSAEDYTAWTRVLITPKRKEAA
jgi:hypothetical protein